jgi:hypothetical protein
VLKYPKFQRYHRPLTLNAPRTHSSDIMQNHSRTQIATHKRTRNDPEPSPPIAPPTVRSKRTRYERPTPQNKQMRPCKRPSDARAKEPQRGQLGCGGAAAVVAVAAVPMVVPLV